MPAFGGHSFCANDTAGSRWIADTQLVQIAHIYGEVVVKPAE